MKKLLLSSVALLVFVVCHSQETFTIAQYIGHAKTAEKAGLLIFAADEYIQAGRLHVEESEKSVLSGSAYNHLKSARDCYRKAADYYHKKVKLREEDDARQRIAMVEMMIALKGFQDLDYDDNKTEPEKNDEPEDKDQVKYLKGGDVYFKAQKTTFVFNPPKELKYNGVKEQKNEAYGNKGPVLYNMYGSQDRILIQLQEWVGDNEGNKRQSTDFCDAGIKQQTKTGQSVVNVGLNSQVHFEMLPLSFGKVCLKTQESTPIGTNNRKFSFTLSFYYNESGYIFSGSAPISWKQSLLKAIETFRIVDDKPVVPEKCVQNTTQLLESKAFYSSYYLPDPSRRVTITIKPVLQRGKVPSAWHTIIDATRRMVGQIKEKELSLETASEEMTEDAEKIIFYLNKLGFNAITPQRVADAYLEAFDKIVYGIEGLEAKITNMSVDFSYSIPFIEVRTKCVPQLKCSNGKWEPDYKNMVYQKLYEKKRTDRYSRDFMTMKQVQDIQETLMKDFLQNLETDKVKYASAGKCLEHIVELFELDFGVLPDECKKREAKLQTLIEEQSGLTEERKYYRDLLIKYKNAKPVRIAGITNAISEIEKRITTNKKELATAENLKKNYQANPDKETPEKTKLLIKEQDDKISLLEKEILDLNIAKDKYNSELESLNANKFENETGEKMKQIDARVSELKKEIPAAQRSVVACK